MTTWDPTRSPTGARITDQLLPLAERLVRGVHDGDRFAVNTALFLATETVGDPLQAARALAVVLAAMCNDEPAVELLQWRRNPTEYRRLRNAGVQPTAARVLAARVANYLTARKRPNKSDLGVA